MHAQICSVIICTIRENFREVWTYCPGRRGTLQDFDQSLRIEEMAQDLGMSVSGFHHHFKAVTAQSPLQFQKSLRLREARRLMLSEGPDAARAAYRVRNHDASHFKREYKRVFGEPPMRDVQRVRKASRQERADQPERTAILA